MLGWNIAKSRRHEMSGLPRTPVRFRVHNKELIFDGGISRVQSDQLYKVIALYSLSFGSHIHLANNVKMLAVLRGASPPRTQSAAQNPILYENGKSKMQFHEKGSEFIMTHTIPPTWLMPGQEPSIVQPPFHYHIYQSETFRVQKGVGNFYRGLAREPFVILSDKPGAQRQAHVANGRYHRFENGSDSEDLVVDIQLDPEDYENEQRFFRNFFGYLSDCKQHKIAPSIFQLLVFLHSADTPLAVPGPNEFIGRILSRLLLWIVAYWGTYVLGYKTTYSEYYQPGPKTR